MPWVKVDDHLDDNEKIGEAGPLGMALYVAGLCYCNRNLTDGHIKKGVARKLQDFSEHGGPQPVIDSLLEAGLWEATDKGYLVHDYLKFQPSRAKVLKDREDAQKRMKKSRSGDVPPAEEPNDDEGSLDVRANNGRTGERSSRAPVTRVPVPEVPGSPPPDSGGGAEEIGDRVQAIMFELLRETEPSGEKTFLGSDLTEALNSLRRRLVTGETFSTPVEWVRSRALTERAKRLAAVVKRSTSDCTTCAQTGWLEQESDEGTTVTPCPDCKGLVEAGRPA